MKQKSLKIISASRRVEMVGFYPEKLQQLLQSRCPPEKVHTLVLWSKDPRNILTNLSLRKKLKEYDQVFLHYTISGMGGSALEPGIPDTETALTLLPDLVDFLGKSMRIRIRFDPIVHIKHKNGSIYSNLDYFPDIAKRARLCGISNLVISWMQLYPKVIRRLKARQLVHMPLTMAEWNIEKQWIFEQAQKIGVHIQGCCVNGLPVSKCIDGRELNRLHPFQSEAALEPAGGQRERCGCTKSWDIGWYFPCPGGCLYCYANPRIPASE